MSLQAVKPREDILVQTLFKENFPYRLKESIIYSLFSFMCFLATVSSAGNLFLLPSKAPEDIYDIAFSVKMGNYCARR